MLKELESKGAEESRLRSVVDSLENKCSRLRGYAKKLTSKCEEWEASYEQQSKSFDKLQAKSNRIRDRAREMSKRYQQLAGDVQRKSQVSEDLFRGVIFEINFC